MVHRLGPHRSAQHRARTGAAWRGARDLRDRRAHRLAYAPLGHRHWHGVTPTTAMPHIAIQESKDGKMVDWMEHVTDEHYLAGPPQAAGSGR